MVAYYNDSDPFCCAWLRNLIAGGFIPGGYVDERDIRDVEPDDLRGYRQCHFFAGIRGWAYALQLAGWDMDRPLWTGSCPCQPFSSAGRQGGALDERHLWPRWLRLIEVCKPHTILGEQVEGAVGFGWVDRVFADLEAQGYACGAAVLGAHSVGAPHIRQRLFWVAQRMGESYGDDAAQERAGIGTIGEQRPALGRGPKQYAGPGTASGIVGWDLAQGNGWVAHSQEQFGAGVGIGERAQRDEARALGRAGNGGAACGLADAEHAERGALSGHRSNGCDGADGGRQKAYRQPRARSEVLGFWDDAVWLPCLDGKARRVIASVQPLAHAGECICGLRLGELCACGEKRPSRVGMLRGSGNAIVPATAAAFIEAVMEVCP